ncbi:hypothetical protein FRB95_014183 [Tulasnella sp. JGI-2019a]|nr:hypothetical protein FRB95_014183 [Tulasnella sp. JGI-2019a]
MFSPKGNGGKSGAGSQGVGPASTDSTPPPGHPSQSPAVIQQQQPQSNVPYPYGTAHPPYPIPFPFHLVGQPGQPHHSHHPARADQQSNVAVVAGIGGAGNQQQGTGSGLIDPMLSTLSDGEGGMSEDEGAGGVKGARNTSVSGHNGISSVNTPHPSQQQQLRHEQHEDEDFNGDGSQHMHSVGGADVGQSAEGGQPKKKRRRQALSCTECKRRKIKCDRANPCGPCGRRGEADKCQWSTQEPLSDPDPNLSSLSSEKFVTRAEHDLLQAKVMQLETIVATLAPRAYLGGLEHLNIPMGPPPFGFGPPHQGPGHPGGPPHHPYPGAPPHGPPGQEGQFQNPAGGSSGPATTQELHQAYQQHFHGYPHPVPQQAPQEAQAAPPAQDNQMEVDQQASQQQQTGGEPKTDVQKAVEGSPHANAIDPNFGQNAATVGHINELSALLSAAAAGKAEQPLPASRQKSRKRKQVEGEVPGEDGQAGSAAGTPIRGGTAVRGKVKPRGAKAAGAVSHAPPAPGGWDAAAAEAVAMAAAQGQEEDQLADNGDGSQDAVTS